jgi:hypothetical protein
MGWKTMTQITHNPKPEVSRFEKDANAHSAGVVAEFAHLLKHNKKWWLTPIILILLLLGLLVVLAGTAVGPFIYTLF